MNEAIRFFLQDPNVKRLVDAVSGRRARAGGVTSGAASLLAAGLSVSTGREVLLVVGHIDLAEELHENTALFAVDSALLEPRETVASFEGGAQAEAASRIRLFQRYLDGASRPAVVVASAGALVEGGPTPSALASDALTISKGQPLNRGELLEWLEAHDFAREYEAGGAREYAVRGGIVDIFPPAENSPARVEFFGDEVASIRALDPATSLSVAELPSLTVVAPGASAEGSCGAPFTSLLGKDAIVVLWEPSDIQNAAEKHIARAVPSRSLSWETVWQALAEFTMVETTNFAFEGGDGLHLGSRTFAMAAQEVEGIAEEFAEFAGSMRRTWVFAVNEAERARLEELFSERTGSVERLFTGVVGRFNHSFYLTGRRLAFVAHPDIFHRYRQRRNVRRAPPSRPIGSILELDPGGYVVHTDHGVARYIGTRVAESEGVRREYLVLEFARKTRLLVPVSHIDLVSKYMGPSDRAPSLDTIGSKTWKAKKARAVRAVRELAAELLRLEAVRASKPGVAFGVDGPYQSEFEAEFIYEETEDQLRALDEIKADMASARPMDRLLCGDVGFGKTELAVRAAFVAVAAGKQVALLVPTTILAEQHYRTFTERMADYPVLIEVLSRLRSKSEQRATLKRLREKQVDIVIGTHRLAQRDVVFADLGLVIIDEEQRFGVAAKERLKRLRETVDVLTLTATPIPRTLHMALVGLKDISTLDTPPLGRQAISTLVGRLSREQIREVILRELAREGQVFFVHNRVHSIESVAGRLRETVPEARIVVAHGQMHENLLAGHMLDFIGGKHDVLVSTTIIESGLDIPNVNTIIIDQADLFGLGDLHQLRGRVGRYKRHAYAYFLLPETRGLTPEASQRLQAIEHFSELGAGFRIALRDMEIRGVGNVLGPQQSGHIAAIGYELYCRLLGEAVTSIRGQKAAAIPESYIELGTGSCLPASYVESPSGRLDLYKRIATAAAVEDVEELELELVDRFGPPPEEAEEFMLLAKLRILAFERGIRMIMLRDGHLAVQARSAASIVGVFEGGGRVVRVVDEHDACVFFEGEPPGGVRLLRLVINILQGTAAAI